MDIIDIAEVARRTGLTARALRFYEARGLVRPLRTAAGRRCYGAGELARLHAVVALKRAGFPLAAIGRILAGREPDLARLVAAQIAEVEARAADLSDTRALLARVQSRIDRGEPIDVATLCSLIEKGQKMTDNWKSVTDRYLSDEANADFAAASPPEGFDQQAYSAQWTQLAARIEAALPMDPASAPARAFYEEWQTLLAPFTAIATPAMCQGVTKMYDRADEWQGDATPPFSPAVWAFIKSVGKERQSAA